jgi:hypothetical protein
VSSPCAEDFAAYTSKVKVMIVEARWERTRFD